MIHYISTICGFKSTILNIDNQSKQCVLMVWLLWTILSISTAFSALISFQSLMNIDSLVFAIAIFMVFLSIQIFLYRNLLCQILFSPMRDSKRLSLIEIALCLTNLFCWMPNLFYRFVGLVPNNFSVVEIITLNMASFTFVLLVQGLIIFLNIVSVYVLSLSCRRHNTISSSILKF